MRAVDHSVASIVQAYKDLGIWEDTLLVFSTDNGGNTDTGGSNWPLRGIKATTFEGGVRGVGFVSGGTHSGISPDVRGSVSDALIHVSDWYPTLVFGAANATPTVDATEPPLDGINAWDAITQGLPGTRREILLNLNPHVCAQGHCQVQGQAAIRFDSWKLIVGRPAVWGDTTPTYGGSSCAERDGQIQPSASLPITKATSPPFCPTGWVPPPESQLPIRPPPDGGCQSLPCSMNTTRYNFGGYWLFDLATDPLEQHDVAHQHEDVVKMLLDKLSSFNATHIPQDNPPMDPASNPNNFDGVWTPWKGDRDPTRCAWAE